MNTDKAKSALNKVAILISILAIAALLFAAWFSIQFAKSKTKIAFDKQQIYFNSIYSNFNQEWAKNALWENGYVEKNKYLSIQNVDRKPIKSLLMMSISKEMFNDQFNVNSKSLERPDLYPVMKVMVKASPDQEEILPQIFNAMYFLQSNAMVLHKMTSSASDINGNTFKSWMNTKSILTMSYDSYLDYEGIGKKVFSKDLFLEEQLPYSLRALKFADSLQFKADVLETQGSISLGKLEVYHAKFIVSKFANNSWKVAVQLDNKKINNYYFENTYPNKFIKMDTWDGRRLQILSSNE